jgi:hypothetical protein
VACEREHVQLSYRDHEEVLCSSSPSSLTCLTFRFVLRVREQARPSPSTSNESISFTVYTRKLFRSELIVYDELRVSRSADSCLVSIFS